MEKNTDKKNVSNQKKNSVLSGSVMILLILIVVFLIAVPLFINKDFAFSGADGNALDIINEVNPNYKPWFSSIWAPPGSEIETLIFCIQSSLGTAVIFYILGFLRGKKIKIETEGKNSKY